MTRIAIFIPYFGKWPEWYPLYFETLRRNSSIDFLFYTDCDISVCDAPNVKFFKIEFDQYIDLVNERLGYPFHPKMAYKLCDLRPFFGYIHADLFSSYQFYGWTDMDLLFGDIRSFYTEDILARYDVLSTHAHRVSGHLALFRNTPKNRLIFHKVYAWQQALDKEQYVGIDEYGLTNAYTMTFIDKVNQKFGLKINNFITRAISKFKKRKMYLVEQYTTPFTPIPWTDGSINSSQPDIWYYRNGEIANSRDGDRRFIYLHFMNFKSSLWRHDGTKAPWEGLKQISCASVSDMFGNGMIINRSGIMPFQKHN